MVSFARQNRQLMLISFVTLLCTFIFYHSTKTTGLKSISFAFWRITKSTEFLMCYDWVKDTIIPPSSEPYEIESAATPSYYAQIVQEKIMNDVCNLL